jgi:hypothetical protein
MYKESLIPLWTDTDGPAALDKLARRPVLMEVEALDATFRGEMIHLSPATARVLPDEPILLRPNLRVRAIFQFSGVEYTLVGVTMVNDHDESIIFEFDWVTRRQMVELSAHLKDAGLLQAAELAAQLTPEDPESPAPGAKPRPTKAELRRVRREKPPGGIERRVHYRHEMEAMATLSVVDMGIAIRCLLLEISLSGCRLFMDSPTQIQEDTQVEVDFVGLGYPLRIAANVKVKTDHHVLGLRFHTMSARTSDRLARLLNELREKCPKV